MQKTVTYHESLEFAGLVINFSGSYRQDVVGGCYAEGFTNEGLVFSITHKDSEVRLASGDLTADDISNLRTVLKNIQTQPLPYEDVAGNF